MSLLAHCEGLRARPLTMDQDITDQNDDIYQDSDQDERHYFEREQIDNYAYDYSVRNDYENR